MWIEQIHFLYHEEGWQKVFTQFVLAPGDIFATSSDTIHVDHVQRVSLQSLKHYGRHSLHKHFDKDIPVNA